MFARIQQHVLEMVMNKQTVQLSSAAIVAATAIMAVTLLITEAVVANSVEKNGYDFPKQ